MADAAIEMHEAREDFDATMTAHLLNMSGKRTRRHITPDDVLGRATRARRRAAAEYKKKRSTRAVEAPGEGD